MVREGRERGVFSDELVDAAVILLRDKLERTRSSFTIIPVPSCGGRGAVEDFSQRLARRLDIGWSACVNKVVDNAPQSEMRNSWHRARNLDGVFDIEGDVPAEGPVLLVDDVVDSRWTLTLLGALLRDAGSGPVHPFVLAAATGAGF